jgi:hypothetical protein
VRAREQRQDGCDDAEFHSTRDITRWA